MVIVPWLYTVERNRFAVASRADTARGKVLEQNGFSFPVIFL